VIWGNQGAEARGHHVPQPPARGDAGRDPGRDPDSRRAAAPAHAEPDRRGATQTQSAYRECTRDARFGACSAYVSKHVRAFKAGRLSRAPKRPGYPGWFKYRVIRKIMKKSDRYTKGDGPSIWQKFIRSDTCITWGVDPRTGSHPPQECKNGVRKIRQLNKTEVVVLRTGVGFWAGFAVGGATGGASEAWIGAGAGAAERLWDTL
jgi:hypothetical protein